MKFLRYILFPIVPVYYLITWVRNWLYDKGFKASKSYNLPVICVGNLSVGGTGKSPMIEYLIQLLKIDFNVATLSRGYKRESEGFVIGDELATAKTLGDEPFQFYNKFSDSVTVAVDSNRQNGISQLMAKVNPDVILLDDAYQHRKVQAGFNILLTTYEKPYFKDMVLPTGDLREPKNGAKRADCIVVTKCPKVLSDAEKKQFIERINPTEGQNVFFSRIRYSDVIFSKTSQKPLQGLPKFTLVTGIANATPLVEFLKAENLEFEHLNFSDHYNFKAEDIKTFKDDDLIVTTEKDFMRLQVFEALNDKLFYLPIAVTIDKPTVFNEIITGFVKR